MLQLNGNEIHSMFYAKKFLCITILFYCILRRIRANSFREENMHFIKQPTELFGRMQVNAKIIDGQNQKHSIAIISCLSSWGKYT